MLATIEYYRENTNEIPNVTGVPTIIIIMYGIKKVVNWIELENK